MTMQNILSGMRRAVTDFNMIESGDKIAVGISGGKDSLTLIQALAAYRRFSPQPFTLHAINIDMGFENTDREITARLSDFIAALDVSYTSVKTDIAEIIFQARKEKNPCSLCSKMRRGALNQTAVELGCNKLALGHHADDLVETMLLSLLFEGRFSTFSPVSFMDRMKITLIRPLIYLDEKDIRSFTKDMPILKNPCPADKNTKRQYVKKLIASIKCQVPEARDRMIGAILHPERNNLWDAKEMIQRIK